MRKYVDGKRYDTDTAKKIGVLSSDAPMTDFEYWEEILYRTKSGRYFLYKWGRPNSKYGVWAGNEGHAGEYIVPLAYDQAKVWARDYLAADEYDAAFCADEMSSDDACLYLSGINPVVYNRLRERAAREGTTLKAVCEAALRQYLEVDDHGSASSDHMGQ